MAINKVVYGDTPLIDLTEDTVSPENLMAGETAHDRSGEEIEGTLITNEVKEVPYEEWSEMTPEEQADGSVYFIPNYPVLGGVYFFQSEEAMRAAEAILPDNAICITWEDTPYVVTADVVEYDNTDSGLEADNVKDAVDEVVDALDGKQDALTNPLTQSDVVNTLTSTSTLLPLSAAMGKALNDEISGGPILYYQSVKGTSDTSGNVFIRHFNGDYITIFANSDTVGYMGYVFYWPASGDFYFHLMNSVGTNAVGVSVSLSVYYLKYNIHHI